MPSVGNGHLATVALSPTVYVNGLYNGPTGWSHRARIPSLNSLHLTVSGVGETDTTRTFSLDVRRAVFTETIDTPMLSIEHRVYAHQYYVRLLITEVIVTRKAVAEGQDVIINVKNSFQNNFTSEDIQFEPKVNLGREDLCPRWNCWRTKGTTLIPEREGTPLQDIYIAWYEIPDTLTLHTGSNTDRWIYMTAIDQTIDRSNMNFEAGRRDFLSDNNLVFQRHVDAWTAKWNNGHIEIKDNLQLAKLVHGSFYYIMSSLPSEKTYLPTNQFYGLSPGGLANGANWTDYQGHVFWDMETWMYPPILMFHPGLAKAMLSYRIYAMPPSYERAASGGYGGLRYPWEGASSGAEVTPDICVPCRENQQHITGDIAFAARQYLSATRDMQWLKHEKGYEFIRDMGKFWVTRPAWNEDKQAFEINGVMPPDEHQISINNSVYTNIGAKLSVHFANYASCLAGEHVNSTWTDIADKIYIPFDERRQYHPEFEGYEDVTGEKAVVKQADTILAGFPQMWPMSREVRRNDLEVYDDVTTPLGPAMTWGMFSIGWLELGDEAKAKELFHKSYSLYAREPFKIWTEARSGIGAVNFITGMGGFLQAVLFGYGGARLHVETLDLDPKVIPGTSGMRLVSLDYLGNSLDVDIGINTVRVVKSKSSEHDIELIVNRTGQRLLLERDNEVVIPREAFSIRGVDTTDCPLPEGSSCPVVLGRRAWRAVDVDTSTPRSSMYSHVVVYQTGGEMCEELVKCKRMMHHIQGQQVTTQRPDIAYNFLIDNDGNVYEGRGWDRLVVLTGDYADTSLAVGFLGDFTCSRPSERALAALKRLVKCGVEKKKILAEYNVLSERQVKTFSCPTLTCSGDRLLCALKTWRRWKPLQTGGEFREPNCDGLCLSPTATASPVSKYSDISDDPDIFSTDKLPLKDNSEEIDFRYMASVGNGHLATLVKSDTIYVNGLYNGPKGWSHRARIPATQAITVTPQDGDEGTRVYSLYVKKGTFEEVLTLPGVKVTQRTYAHQYYNRLLVTDVIFTRTSATEDIVFNVVNNHGGPSEDITFTEPEDYVSSMYKFQEGRTRIPEIEGEDTQSVYLYYTTIQSTLTFRSSEKSKTYCVITSIDPDRYTARNNFDEALRIMAIKPELLYQRHLEAWRNKWDGGRIDVDGNTKLSKLINSCFYYLMSFLPSMDTFLPNRKFGGLSPGGLANGANWTDYQGHVFWDMETWMYPTMLMFHPELGEQMLSYRINNMEPAYDRARSGGYEGLRFPWESAQTGVEVTPDVCPACRENQQHVTGDIALAARQYVTATRDIDWLSGKKGYVFLKDMARFWKSRPTYNPETLQYDINGVMPPDEHAEFVNNSVYTNVGAKLAINFGRYAACLAGKDAHSEVPDEWLEVSRKIALLFDENENFHPEYEGYTDEKDPRGVKQADVVLLGYPQMWPMPEEVRRNDLVRYERVNNPLGPAMTWGMFSIAWLELGDEEKAAEMFERSYGLYNREPFKIWTEARQGIGAVNFLTGMGGFLQAVFFGYGGARLHTESLDFDPRLPPGSRGMRFTGFNYLGNSIDMKIKADHVSVLLRSESPLNQLLLTVKKTGALFLLKTGKEFLMPRQAFSLQSLEVTDCLLPEETSCPQIVGRREWGAADAKEAAGKVDHVTMVLIHQTGGPVCQTLDACKRSVKHIQYMHQETQKNSDIPYNFLVGKDGRVYEGRGWGVMSQQHDEDISRDSISIGFIGDFTCTDPADIYIHAMKRLIKCAVEMGHLSENYRVKYESQVSSSPCTASRCPGDRLFCAVTTMKHWETHTDREPDCSTPCDDVTESTSTNLYPDTGPNAHLFETDRLPMTPGSNMIDFRYMASVANGHLGTVVYSDTIYVNGLYNGPFGWSHRARIPSTQAMRVHLDSETDVQHHYTLDTEKATFEEKLTTPDTEVIIRTYAHQKHTRLLITEIRAKRLSESLGQVTMTLTNNRGEDSDDIAFNEAQTYRGDYWKQTGQTKQTETADTPVSDVVMYYSKLPNKLTLKSGVASDTWVFFTAIDKDGRVAKASFDDAISLVESNKDSLYESHVTAWTERWSRGRVLVEGNVLLSKLINGCFYYLLSFLPSFDPSFPNDQFYGLSPGGLANGANWTDYQGHVFWDMETWMYPGILAFHPELAKAMLSYRIYGMHEAYKRAREGGYQGLRFPWESAFTGAEQTPEICVPCRENQQHITGDIALAARQYLTVTRDLPWLKDQAGYQLIRDMGKFWTSRVEWNEQTRKYDIRGVMPPDEHAINVTNSVYTNVGAKLSINFARYAACLNNMTDDVDTDWSRIADQIALPYDDVKMFHPEYEGYQDGDDDRGVKQADVILLGYPQMWPVEREVRRNDLVKYEKVTNVMGPAMTWGMFSIGWLELDQEDKAEELFHHSYRPYVREPFRVWTETRAGIGAVNFITGMGGFLQSVIFGYGGLRIHTEQLSFNPRVLPGSKGLIFEGLDYLGNSLDIWIRPDHVSVVVRKTSSFPLILRVDATTAVYHLHQDEEMLLSRQPFSIRTTELSECPLPEESSCPEIVKRSDWGSELSRPRGSPSLENYVVVHQTGGETCTNWRDCTLALQQMQLTARSSGKQDLQYNFLVGGDGRVYEGRGWNAVGDFADNFNTEAIGVAVIGDFTYHRPSKLVVSQIRRLIKCGMERNKIALNYTLLWEKQVAPSTCTACPGDLMLCEIMTFRHWSNHQVGGEFLDPECGTIPTAPPSPVPTNRPGPTVTCGAASPSHAILTLAVLSYISVMLLR
ncbi:uncharacterized protein [Haliotis asinina]|uniref:uncharacterized protein n=1 Tax=Haliotis asinina TaxID=109174 RepID=UPI00353274E9